MPTLVELTPSSFTQSNCQGVNTSDVAISLGLLTDSPGDPTTTRVDMCRTGGSFFTTSNLEISYPNPSVGAGQAIGRFQHFDDTTISGGLGNATGRRMFFITSTGSNNFYTITGYTGGSLIFPGITTNFDTSPGSSNTDLSVVTGIKMRHEATATTAGITVANVRTCRLFIERYNRPTLTVTSPSPVAGASVTTTFRPTITWTFAGDGLPQHGFRVRVFTAAQYGIGGFNPLTSPATHDSGDVTSAANSYTVTSNLSTLTYRAYVWAWSLLPSGMLHTTHKDTTVVALGQAAYSQFTISPAPPNVPTTVIPASGATVTTDIPTLGCFLPGSPISGVQVSAEWQLATDAGFTSNVRTVTESTLDRILSGTATEPSVAGASELFQGTWFIRARARDSLFNNSAYSAAHTFTVTHPPTTTNFAPAGQVTRPFGGSGTTTFSWTFSDTSPTDTQTAFQILVERDSDGFLIYDSGKQTSTANSFSTNLAATYKDTLLRWRIRAWDSDDVAGAYSANQQFFIRDAGTATMTSPATGGTVNNPTPTLGWSFSATAGRTQSAFRLTISRLGVVIVESGWVSSSVNSYPVTVNLTNALTYDVTLMVRDSMNLESTTNATFSTAWTPAPSPTPVTFDATNFRTLGSTTVTWPQNRDVNFVGYRIYRRLVGSTQWTFLAEDTSTGPATYTFTDNAAPMNQPVEYGVAQSALRFGVPVEGTPTVSNSATPASESYWLISSTGNIELRNVVSDSFSDEYENAEIKLLGRGRRVETGTHFGIRGELTAKVYGTPTTTPRAIRLMLQQLRDAQDTVLLRTPFGDIWRVAVSDLTFERTPGVGLNEYFTVSLPYMEVSV
jgi:hypothetical protein